MQYFLKASLLIAVSLIIASCSFLSGNNGIIQNRGTDYLKARSIAPLQIPPGISSSSIHTEYPVSDRYYPGSEKEVNLVPPELN
jgi:uncharacterized lipoprotein